MAMLDQELETYERHRERLLQDSEGKYVLIYRDDMLTVFESKNDAIAEGYRRLGNVPFLVKEIVQVEIPARFVSPTLAL